MEFDEYQEKAHLTAEYSFLYLKRKNDNFPSEIQWIYPLIGLQAEIGELSNKLKKVIRGDFKESELSIFLVSELGDILWYVSELARKFGFPLGFIALENLNKLELRKQKGTIKGDNRTD
jgi:NTP pyrophosphatase (non-canonical NTP hydrolase)